MDLNHPGFKVAGGLTGAFILYKLFPILDILEVICILLVGVAFVVFLGEAIGGTVGLLQGHNFSQAIEAKVNDFKNWRERKRAELVAKLEATDVDGIPAADDTPTSA